MRLKLNIWEEKLLYSISRYLLQRWRVCSLIYDNIVELNINQDIYIYIHVPRYHVLLLSHCIQHWKNQFSNTQQYVLTAGYDELRWTSISNKLSPISILQITDVLSEAKCSLCLVAAFCVHSVESVEDVWELEEFYIYRAEENWCYLVDRITKTIYERSRWSDLSSNPSLTPIIPHYLPAQLFVILGIKLSTDQGHCPDTAANCT